MADMLPSDESVVIVGVCGSGKSTLAGGLQALGCPARVCGQEHSCVPALWRRRGRPRALIYLDASLETVCSRCGTRWEDSFLAAQEARLALARRDCDLYVDTDPLTIAQVLNAAVHHLRGANLLGPDGRWRDGAAV